MSTAALVAAFASVAVVSFALGILFTLWLITEPDPRPGFVEDRL